MNCKLLLLVSVLLTSVSHAQRPGRTWAHAAPLCGIRSLYTALQIEGVQTDFSSLLNARYVPTQVGSSFASLREAVVDQHAHVEIVENLGINDLTALFHPAILHVRAELDSPDVNHFVLFVSTPEKGLMIYDAPEEPRSISSSELSAIWDGTAMIVSAHPLPPSHVAAAHVWRAAQRVFPAIIAITIFIGVRTLLSLNALPSVILTTRRQSAVLLGGAMTAAILFNSIAAGGLLRDHQISRIVAESKRVASAQQIGLLEMQKRLRDGGVAIDARNATDFREGHVSMALNLPPDTSRIDRAALMLTVPKSKPIVVYCASPSCPNAAIIANRLHRDGFANVAVFVAGWEAWMINNQPISMN